MNDLSKYCEELIYGASPNSTPSPASAAGPSLSSSPAGPKIEKSGPAPVPASPSRAPGKARAKKTPGISGPISYASSPSGDLQRSLENRLRARLGVGGSPEYELTWKHWATESGSPICALRASARRISDKGSIGWPTCRAIDGTKGQRTLEGVERERERKGGKPPDELPSVVMLAGYPTPNVPNGGRQPAGGMSPTGKTLDGKKRQVGTEQIALLAGWPTASVFLAAGDPEKVKARRAECKERHGNNGFGMNLEQAAQALVPRGLIAGWPTTTTTRDSKGTDAPNMEGAPSLCEVAGLTVVSFFVPTGKRVVLAPEFSLWLMGFPEAWAKAAPNSDAWRAAQAALESEC